MCNYYVFTRNCRNGDKCRFKHQFGNDVTNIIKKLWDEQDRVKDLNKELDQLTSSDFKNTNIIQQYSYKIDELNTRLRDIQDLNEKKDRENKEDKENTKKIMENEVLKLTNIILELKLENENKKLENKKLLDEYELLENKYNDVKNIFELLESIFERKEKEVKDETPLVFFSGIDEDEKDNMDNMNDIEVYKEFIQLVKEKRDKRNKGEKREKKREKGENICKFQDIVQYKGENKDEEKIEYKNQIEWMYEGDNGFDKYSKSVIDMFESKYQIESKILISLNSYTYEIDFKNLTQRNTTTNKIRKIKRVIIRTVYSSSIQKTINGEILADYSMENLSSSSDEYKLIYNMFYTTMTNAKVIKIEKVYNPVSRLLFETKRGLMSNKSQEIFFHGTRSIDYLVPCKEGLDFRLGSISSYFGKGIYVSKLANYSHKSFVHTIGNTYVLLCVICLPGNSKTYHTYEKLDRPPMSYDSVNISIDGTTMYVFYDNSQCYVSHAIHYTI